jgi:hypothetical protein
MKCFKQYDAIKKQPRVPAPVVDFSGRFHDRKVSAILYAGYLISKTALFLPGAVRAHFFYHISNLNHAALARYR